MPERRDANAPVIDRDAHDGDDAARDRSADGGSAGNGPTDDALVDDGSSRDAAVSRGSVVPSDRVGTPDDRSGARDGRPRPAPAPTPRPPGSLRAYAWFRAVTAPLYWLYERRLASRIRTGPLPNHIGIIMDGNRRFARLAGVDVEQGHDVGASKAHEVLDWCLELGIPHVTLWGFSSDNKGRAPEEVAHLHRIFADQARALAEDPRLTRHRVRVRVIGDVSSFSEDARDALRAIEARTADHDGMHLNLALGYGGREEIVAAVRTLLDHRARDGAGIEDVAQDLDADAIGQHLWTAGMPDPDFVIRTSGEVRLSGFLLWQTAYAEFYFCDAFWPDFRRVDFLRAIRSFQARERRFGR